MYSMANENCKGRQNQKWKNIYRKGIPNWLLSYSSNKIKYNPSWLSLKIVFEFVQQSLQNNTMFLLKGVFSHLLKETMGKARIKLTIELG